MIKHKKYLDALQRAVLVKKIPEPGKRESYFEDLNLIRKYKDILFEEVFLKENESQEVIKLYTALRDNINDVLLESHSIHMQYLSEHFAKLALITSTGFEDIFKTIGNIEPKNINYLNRVLEDLSKNISEK